MRKFNRRWIAPGVLVLFLFITGVVIVFYFTINPGYHQESNYFSQANINKLITRSNRYGMTRGIDQLDNRYYSKFPQITPDKHSFVDTVNNSISDNNLWQYHKSPLVMSVENLQSSLPLTDLHNENSITTRDYAIDFPIAITDPQNHEQTFSLQLSQHDQYPLFNNHIIKLDNTFPPVKHAVYYFDSNSDLADASMSRIETPLFSLYIFCENRYTCIYSFASAYGGYHWPQVEQKNSLNKASLNTTHYPYPYSYPYLYTNPTKTPTLATPFQIQNITTFFSFSNTGNSLSNFLTKLIGCFLNQATLFETGDGDNANSQDYEYKVPVVNEDGTDPKANFTNETKMFTDFKGIFSLANLKCMNDSKLLKNLNGYTITTKSLSPPLLKNASPSYQYHNINSKYAIKWHAYSHTCEFLSNSSLVPLPIRFYSRILLASKFNFFPGPTNWNSWWQTYCVNAWCSDGTRPLSEYFNLVMQNPQLFNFRSGNPFDYKVKISRSSEINALLLVFVALDSIGVGVIVILLTIHYRIRYFTSLKSHKTK